MSTNTSRGTQSEQPSYEFRFCRQHQTKRIGDYVEEIIKGIEEFARANAHSIGLFMFWFFLPITLPFMAMKGIISDLLKCIYLFELVLDNSILKFEAINEVLEEMRDSEENNDYSAFRILQNLNLFDGILTSPIEKLTRLLTLLNTPRVSTSPTFLINTGVLMKKQGQKCFSKMYLPIHEKSETNQNNVDDKEIGNATGVAGPSAGNHIPPSNQSRQNPREGRRRSATGRNNEGRRPPLNNNDDNLSDHDDDRQPPSDDRQPVAEDRSASNVYRAPLHEPVLIPNGFGSSTSDSSSCAPYMNGYPERPENIFRDPENLPEGRDEIDN